MKRTRTVAPDMPAPTPEGKQLSPEEAAAVMRVLVWLRDNHAPFKERVNRIAKAFGLSQPSVRDWFGGVKQPGYQSAVRIARWMGAEPEDLLKGNIPPPYGPDMNLAKPPRLRAIARMRGLLPSEMLDRIASDEPSPELENRSELEWVEELIGFYKYQYRARPLGPPPDEPKKLGPPKPKRDA